MLIFANCNNWQRPVPVGPHAHLRAGGVGFESLWLLGLVVSRMCIDIINKNNKILSLKTKNERDLWKKES